ncbi:ABC transporter permease subunit [Ochrobactrum sp. WV_118_8]|uniref:ABC transporter permease subunit n=1 Tax=Brucella anthropi TaxID=529 RepID=A0A6L3Z8Y9_BRUAN|nr:ABC transporter permease subunit [Brucella anthropi]KAB2772311.1 ABC transporter permease subunit [Brucella anthropi]MCR8492805.1 ABC transporter permease subunit [Brucella anthropi]
MQKLIASISSRLVIAVPYLWLLVFFLVPFFIVFKISLSEVAMSIPPYMPTFDLIDGFATNWEKIKQLSFDNYVWLMDDPLYIKAYLSSVRIAALSTLLALLVGYPLAYGIARAPTTIRSTLLMLVILPFWTSFLIRVYAWIGILKPEGLLNQFLMWLNVIDTPLTILNTDTAVYIVIVYCYLPFMVLPIYASLEKLDYSLIEAAQDLGCTPFAAFWKVTFPLSLSGVLAGCFLVMIPAIGEFVIPDMVGGSETLMIGKTIWSEFFSNRDWAVASAVAVVLLGILIIPIVFFQHVQARAQEKGK